MGLVSSNETAREMSRVGLKMTLMFSVGKQVGQWQGKKVRCFFFVKAQERNLLALDEKCGHKYWQWKKVQRGENTVLGVKPQQWAQVKGSDVIEGARAGIGIVMQGTTLKVS